LGVEETFDARAVKRLESFKEGRRESARRSEMSRPRLILKGQISEGRAGRRWRGFVGVRIRRIIFFHRRRVQGSLVRLRVSAWILD
jgi:hypothetical protein